VCVFLSIQRVNSLGIATYTSLQVNYRAFIVRKISGIVEIIEVNTSD